MSFQKVVKQNQALNIVNACFRTVSFQKVVKPFHAYTDNTICFRTVSFQKVVKHKLWQCVTV